MPADEPTPPRPIGRRELLALSALAAGTAASAAAGGGEANTVVGTLPWRDGMADAPGDGVGAGTAFLTPSEMAFVTAAADRLIPADPTGPSASQAGVPTFIDRQLAAGFGKGEHFYLGGPWARGAPTQGYQSRMTPAQYYRAAIAAIADHVARAHGGSAFATLAPAVQDAVLKDLEAGRIDLGAVEATRFFAMFLQNVREGYFSDPIYGGNRGMAAWKMIGFPGAHYDYTDWVSRHGERVTLEPVGLAGRPGWLA